MNFEAIRQADSNSIAATYARFDVCIESGKGAACTDTEGGQYIDFTSGIGVNALGYCDSGWVEAISAQAARLSHTSNLYYTMPSTELATELCRRTGMSRVFLANSGAEANEGAIKAARKYSADRYGEGRTEIVTLTGSFHGRTITTLAATGQDSFHTHFHPFTEGFVYTPANDTAALCSSMSSRTCAVMLELIQGEGGVLPLEQQFVAELADYCSKRDILLIVDEIQTGIGRTGTLLACEQYGITPDIVTLAKGLGGGLPIGAVLFGSKTASVLGAGTHGSTFGANPICCAGALYLLSQITPELLSQVAAKGQYATKRLSAMQGASEVTGMGLMLGVRFAGISARAIAEQCLADGLLVLTAKDKIRLLPPLSIEQEQLEQGLDILHLAVDKIANREGVTV